MVIFKFICDLTKGKCSQKMYSRIRIGAELQILDNQIRIINGIASIFVSGAES